MSDQRRDQRDEERIRQRAYALWEEEGRPEGRAETHWDQARELVAIEDSYLDTLQPRESGVEDVEPTEATENQGDMPGLRDQGAADEPTKVANVPRRRR